VDLEASVGISALTLRGAIDANSTESAFHYAAENDIGIQVDVRMFADASTLNGAFVPHIQANIFNYGEERIIDFNAGVGINLNIDRGFFWAGLEGVYNKTSNILVGQEANGAAKFGKRDVTGGRVGFGIERNVLTDWFVIRVGGSKLFAKESRDSDKSGSKFIETADEDHVSLGMGVNIEDRLKIDFTLAQNLPYTFTNLFSGNSSYLASRVSAVFSF
jgi:hypothetical protein